LGKDQARKEAKVNPSSNESCQVKLDITVEEFLELADAVSPPLTDDDDDVSLRGCIDLNGSDRVSLVHYIIVRADLPHGVQVAQTVHAAGESAAISERIYEMPVLPGTVSVALHAKDSLHLDGIRHALNSVNIGHHCVYEIDAPYNGQLMAIGLFPIPVEDRDTIRAVLGKLPLVS
jgi:hypothetical protein